MKFTKTDTNIIKIITTNVTAKTFFKFNQITFVSSLYESLKKHKIFAIKIIIFS
jgi:hypothetical protein